MQIGVWSFRPGWLPSLATFLVFPLLLALGFWQLDRADHKRELSSDQRERAALAPLVLHDQDGLPADPGTVLWRRSIAEGVYATDRVFLLDNQVHNGSSGYLVLSPFRVKGTGQQVMVNRGWVPAGGFRDQAPDIDTPAGYVTISGIVSLPQNPGLMLDDGEEEFMTDGISRLQSIRFGKLEDMLGHELWPYMIRLEASSPGAYLQAWTDPGTGAERHLGYAFQWFSLAGVLLLIYIFVNTHRRKLT